MRLTIPSLAAAALAGIGVLLPGPAQAQSTTGRLTIMNDYDQMSGPDATLDAALLRLYLKSENTTGDRTLVIDMRSDLPTIATAPNPYSGLGGVLGDNSYPFNDRCRGLNAAATPCQNLPIRNVTLGQLKELAGVWDAYYMIGGLHEDSTAYSLGRKTLYEAGLTTVDGLTVEHTFSTPFRMGAWAGLAPDPITRFLDPDYQTAGAYLALTRSNAVVRMAAAAQGYKGQPDLVSVYNQDFVKLARGLTLAASITVDAVPQAQDRLVWADLTYSPTSQYRVTFNVTRFRPVVFQNSPDLYIQTVDPALAALWTGNLFNTATGRPQPSLLPTSLWSSPIDSGQVSVHYVNTKSFTPYASFKYRTREIDRSSGLDGEVGVYAYDPYDTGLIGRVFGEYESGFDANAIRLALQLDKEVSEQLTIGGGVDVVNASYTQPSLYGAISDGYVSGAQTYGIDLHLRYDRIRGVSYFLEAEVNNQARIAGDEPAGTGTPPASPTSSLEINGLLGVTYRFGQGAR